jgi:hypothetical protein
MNIFILDTDLAKCAQYHVDKHVVKMILEYAQLLSTTVRLSGIDAGYKATHVNHPCTKWCKSSLSNWRYLRELAQEVQNEYYFRYKKVHKSWELILTLPEPNIEDIGLTKFALAMPDQYKVNDAVQSYRNYYKADKRHLAAWKNRTIPDWWE